MARVGAVEVVANVVAEQLHEREHAEAAVLDLLRLASSELLFVEVKEAALLDLAANLSDLEVAEESPVVHRADEEDHLDPAERWDGLEGGNTVGHRRERDARGDVPGEAAELREKGTCCGSCIESRSQQMDTAPLRAIVVAAAAAH